MDLSVHFTFILLSLCDWTRPVMGSGSLYDPPSRHVMWKYNFPTPKNYTYMQQNCGGEKKPGESPKQCGICGYYVNGTTENELAGNPATTVIGRHYPAGIKEFQVKVELMAFEGGFFEFRVCPANNQPVTQACLDEYLLPIKEGYVNGTPFRFYPKSAGDYRLTVAVPPNLTCNRCVLQWSYHTENSWGVDTKTGLEGNGFGPPKEFYNCADIRIGGEIPDSVISNPFFAPEDVGLKPAAHNSDGSLGKVVSVKPVNPPRVDHGSQTTVGAIQESGSYTSTNISLGNFSDTVVSELSTTLNGLQGNVQQSATFFRNNLVSSLEFNPTLSETKVDGSIKASRGSDQRGNIQLRDGQVDTGGATQITVQTSTLNTDPAFIDKSSLKIGLLPVGTADVQSQVISVRQPDSVTPETATLTVDIVRAQTDTNSRQSPGQTTRQLETMDLTNDLSMDGSTSHEAIGFRETGGISTLLKTSDLLPAQTTNLDISASSITGSSSEKASLLDTHVKSSTSMIHSQSVDSLSGVDQNSIDNRLVDSQSGDQVEQPHFNADLNRVNVPNEFVKTHKDFKTIQTVDANVGFESTSTAMDTTADRLTSIDSITNFNNVVQGGQPYVELSLNSGSTPNETFGTPNVQKKPIDPVLVADRSMATSGQNPSTKTSMDMSNSRRDIPADLRTPSYMETALDVNLGMVFPSNIPDNIQTIPDKDPVGGVIGATNIQNDMEIVSDMNAVGVVPNKMETAPIVNLAGDIIDPSNALNNVQTTQDVNLIGGVIGQTNIPNKMETLSGFDLVGGAIVPKDIPNYIETSPGVNKVVGPINKLNTVEKIPDIKPDGVEIGTRNIQNNVETAPVVNLVGDISSPINAPQNIDTIKVESRPTGLTGSSVQHTFEAKSGQLHPDKVILAEKSFTQQNPYVDHSLETQGGSIESIISQINEQILPGLDKSTHVVKTAAQPDQVSVVIQDNLSQVQSLLGAQLDNTLITNRDNLVQTLSMNEQSGTQMSVAKSTNTQNIDSNLQGISDNIVIDKPMNSILGNRNEPLLLPNLLQNSQLNTVSLGSQPTTLLDQNTAMDIINVGIGNSKENQQIDAAPSTESGTSENLGIQNSFASEPSARHDNILEGPAFSNIKVKPDLAVSETKAGGIASSLHLTFPKGQQKSGNVVNENTFISNAVSGGTTFLGQPTTSTEIRAMPIETNIKTSGGDLGNAISDVTSDIYIGTVPNVHSIGAQTPVDQESNKVVTEGRGKIFGSVFNVHAGSRINNNLISGVDITDVTGKSVSSINPDSINLVIEKQNDILSGPITPETRPGISFTNEQIASGPSAGTLVVDSINQAIDSNVKAVSVNEGVWSAPGMDQQNHNKETGSVHSKDSSMTDGFSLNANPQASGSLSATNPEISVGSGSLNDPLTDINTAITNSLTTGSTNLEPFTVNIASDGVNNVASSIVELPSQTDMNLGPANSLQDRSGPSIERIESGVVKLESIDNVNIKNSDSPIQSSFPKENAAITQDAKPVETIATGVKTTSIGGQVFGTSQSSTNLKNDVPSISVTSSVQKSNTVDYVVASGGDTTTDIMTFMKDVRATKELMSRKFQSNSNVESTKRTTTDQNVDIKRQLNNFNMNDIPADSALGGNIQVGADGVLTPRFGQRIDHTTRFRNLNRSPDTTNIRSRSTRTRERSPMPTDQRVLIDPRTGLGSRVRSSPRESVARSRRPGTSVSRDSLADFGPTSSGDQTRFTSFAGDNSVRGGRSFERSRLSSSMPDSIFSAGGRVPSSIAARRDSLRDTSRMRFTSSGPRRVREGRRARGPDDFLSSDFVRDARPFDPTPFNPRFDPLTPFGSERRDRPPFGFVRGADEFLRRPQFSTDLIPRAFERLPPSRIDGSRDQFRIGSEFPLFDSGGFRGFPAGSSPILSPPMGTGLFDPFMGGTLTPTGFSGF